MNALILAGGEGRRLRPLTKETPKPMLHVGGARLIDRAARGLVNAGVNRIVVSTRYRAETIEEHLRSSDLNARFFFYREEEPLGTAGSLRAFGPADAPVLIVNTDVLTSTDLAAMAKFHELRDADLTVGIVRRLFDVPYGIIDVDVVTSRVRGVIEKPSIERWANAGLYVAGPLAIERARRDGPVSMTDLITEMCDAGNVVIAHHVQEYWRDVGTPEDLEAAEADAREGLI